MLKMSQTCTYRSTTQDIHRRQHYCQLGLLSFFVADVKCNLCENKNKNTCTWIEFNPANVLRPNRSDVGPQRSRTRTWTYTNTNLWL